MSEHLDMSTFTTTVIPITVDNLPPGQMFEADGSCWHAIIDPAESKGWRWQPLNWIALCKDEPDSEMTEFVPLNFSSVTRPPKMT
jgi:hypothetical protein